MSLKQLFLKIALNHVKTELYCREKDFKIKDLGVYDNLAFLQTLDISQVW